MSNSPVEIHKTSDPSIALQMKDSLTASGIECYLTNLNSVGNLLTGSSGLNDQIGVYVAESDVEEGMAIIKGWSNSGNSGASIEEMMNHINPSIMSDVNQEDYQVDNLWRLKFWIIAVASLIGLPLVIYLLNTL